MTFEFEVLAMSEMNTTVNYKDTNVTHCDTL